MTFWHEFELASIDRVFLIRGQVGKSPDQRSTGTFPTVLPDGKIMFENPRHGWLMPDYRVSASSRRFRSFQPEFYLTIVKACRESLDVVWTISIEKSNQTDSRLQSGFCLEPDYIQILTQISTTDSRLCRPLLNLFLSQVSWNACFSLSSSIIIANMKTKTLLRGSFTILYNFHDSLQLLLLIFPISLIHKMAWDASWPFWKTQMTNCVSEDKLSLRHTHFHQITLSGISVFKMRFCWKINFGRLRVTLAKILNRSIFWLWRTGRRSEILVRGARGSRLGFTSPDVSFEFGMIHVKNVEHRLIVRKDDSFWNNESSH